MVPPISYYTNKTYPGSVLPHNQQNSLFILNVCIVVCVVLCVCLCARYINKMKESPTHIENLYQIMNVKWVCKREWNYLRVFEISFGVYNVIAIYEFAYCDWSQFYFVSGKNNDFFFVDAVLLDLMNINFGILLLDLPYPLK